MRKILAINPGSTSTKIAVYADETCQWKESIEHSYEEVSSYDTIYDQYPMRIATIEKALAENGTALSDLDAVVGRGGPAMSFKSGAYKLNEDLVELFKSNPKNNHISLLGGIIAYNLAEPLGIPSFIYDAVSIDELSDVARVSGLKGIQRESAGHFLNIRAAARKAAAQKDSSIQDMNLLLAHLGGGITIACMERGRMVELISDDEGPMSPERTGGLPLRKLIDLCYSIKKDEVKKMLRGNGGVVSYLGVTDMREVENRISEGDHAARLIFDAMVYQVSNWISYLAPVVEGNVDGIVLTGGIAYSEKFTEAVSRRIRFIGDVIIIPGENELESLAHGTLRVLNKLEPYSTYIKIEEEQGFV